MSMKSFSMVHWSGFFFSWTQFKRTCQSQPGMGTVGSSGRWQDGMVRHNYHTISAHMGVVIRPPVGKKKLNWTGIRESFRCQLHTQNSHKNKLYFRLGNLFSSGFLTGSTNSGLKGFFFNSGWYYQPRLEVFFFVSFLFCYKCYNMVAVVWFFLL